MIELSLKMATEAHGSINQKRRGGEDYIIHPVAVAEIVSSVPHTPEMVAAAHLHDVIEDVCPKNEKYSEEWIFNLLGSTVLRLVVELTNEFSAEKYPQFNRKIRKQKENERVSSISPEAQTIKLADIIDNCKPGQQSELDNFLQTYRKEKLVQISYLTKGDKSLFDRASIILQ